MNDSHARRSYVARGGHFPGHLRDEFVEALWQYRDDPSTPTDRLVRACGLVWNCTDCLPNDVFVYAAEDIEGVEPKRRTYAALARAVRAALA